MKNKAITETSKAFWEAAKAGVNTRSKSELYSYFR